MQVEDTLGLYQESAKPVYAGKEVYDPAHVNCPIEKKDEGDGVHSCPILDYHCEGQYVYQLACVLHAEVVPAPAAMLGDEVNRRFVQKKVLLF